MCTKFEKLNAFHYSKGVGNVESEIQLSQLSLLMAHNNDNKCSIHLGHHQLKDLTVWMLEDRFSMYCKWSGV